MSEKWRVIPAINGYAVVDKSERIIAETGDQGNAHLIAQLPQLKEVRYEWASIINKLAIDLLGAQSEPPNSNDCDYAEEMIDMVRPFLGCAAQYLPLDTCGAFCYNKTQFTVTTDI